MKLRLIDRCIAVAVITLLPALATAADFDITPQVQAVLDKQKDVAAGWAADPVIVKAVRDQNRKGPIAGMDNRAWQRTRRSDAQIKALQESPAGQFLLAALRGSGGAVTEAFLNGSKGEKVAFAEKTTSYIHAGSAKHDVPFNTGRFWQGEPEFDESSQTYAVQVAVPVLDGGARIGSLVVGVSLSHLAQARR